VGRFGRSTRRPTDVLTMCINLVDETERCIRDNKRGFISENTARTIDQLGINPDTWFDKLKGFKSVGYSAVGTVNQLKDFSTKTKKKWSLGLRLSPALE